MGDLQEIIADGQLVVAAAIALAAGLVSFVSPCILPLLPGYLGYVSAVTGRVDAASKRQRLRPAIGAALFVCGFSAVFVTLLLLSGAIGASAWYLRWQDLLARVLGVVVIVLGLVFMGFFKRLQRSNKLRFKPRVGLAGAPLLGMVFAIGWTPCLGPTIATVSLLALQQGSAARAAVLAICYCAGLGIPFVLVALGFSWAANAAAFVQRHMRAINLAGGALLIIIGVLLAAGWWGAIINYLQGGLSGYASPL